MLGRLLKYEFKSMSRILIPLFIAAIVLGFLTALFFGGSGFDGESLIYTVSMFIFMILFVVLVSASVVIAYVMSIQRFRKNLFGSEGYLMNTLPVSANCHIASKLIVAVLFQILSAIVAVAAWTAFVSTASDISFYEIAVGVKTGFSKLYGFTHGQLPLYMIEMVIVSLISVSCFNLEIYTAISVGHTLNNHKVLMSFIVFIAIYVIENYINTVILYIVPYINIDINALQGIAPHILILCFGLLDLLYAVVFWFVTRYFLKNKLNLQ